MADHSALRAARMGRSISCGERTPTLVIFSALGSFDSFSATYWPDLVSETTPI